MTYKTILFDIDGTLCDPGESIIESARYALGELGIKETDETALRRFVGPPLEHSFRDYYQLDDVTIKQAVALFREKHLEDSKTLYKAYPGITGLLESLHNADFTMAIVTSKIDYIANNALESTGLLKYFKVVGAQQPDEVVEKKVILQLVLDKLQVTNNSEVIMVGDRKHDVEAANACTVDSVGVLWGYGSVEELTNEGATHIVETANELSVLLMS